MEHQNAVIDCYEQIAPLVARMLELARAGNWDALVTLEAQFRADIEHLKSLEPADTLDQPQLAQKRRLLKKSLPTMRKSATSCRRNWRAWAHCWAACSNSTTCIRLTANKVLS
jgi:hypothetical protein